MAILAGTVSIAVVQALRGVIDIYYDHDQLIARGWPRKAVQPRTEKQLAHWDHIRRMHAYLKSNPKSWYSQIGVTSSSPTQSIDDRARWASYALTSHYVRPPLPDIVSMTATAQHSPGVTRVVATINTDDITQYLDICLACVDAKPNEGILRWSPSDERAGRWGARGVICTPPTAGALQPIAIGHNNENKTIVADFECDWTCVLAWPTYADAPEQYTGAAWRAGEPDFPIADIDLTMPLRIARTRASERPEMPFNKAHWCLRKHFY